MVATMGETTAFRPILETVRQRMESDVCGRRILRFDFSMSPFTN